MLASILIAAVIITYMTRQQIIIPIKKLVKAIDEAGNGELAQSFEYNSKDEIGLLTGNFNKMLNNMRKLAGSIQNTAMHLDKTCSQMGISSREMGEASEEIAKTVQEVASGASAQAR